MTAEILEFCAKDDAHATGEAICTHCKREWIAVAPVGQVSLECPSCSLHRGHFKFHFGAPDGAETFQCKCGSDEFFIFRRKGHCSGEVHCRSCGVEATGWFE